MTYTFIARACSDLPVAVCCRVMKVSTSGSYRERLGASRLIFEAASDTHTPGDPADEARALSDASQ